MGITHLDCLRLSPGQVPGSVNGTALSIATGPIVVASVANPAVGLRAIATGGSSVVANTFVRTSSRIFLSPIGMAKNVVVGVSTIASGTNFKILAKTAAGTVGAGRVAWSIVNLH